jgi:hypothetical protein
VFIYDAFSQFYSHYLLGPYHAADIGRWRGTRRRCSSSGGVLCAAAIRKTSPSRRYMVPNLASQTHTAFASMVSKTGSSSLGELEMTCSTSAVAFSRSSASSRSRISHVGSCFVVCRGWIA